MLMPSIFGENLFDDWMDFSFPDIDKALYGKHSRNLMKTDIRETDKNYELDIDLPGFKKEEVSAKLEKGYLTINANKSLEKESEKKGDRYLRRERYSGAMSRSFYVGENITKDDVHAKFEDGILRLSLPKNVKREVPENKFIAIEG